MCQAFSRDFPGDSAVKNPHAMKETCTGDASFIPGLGRFPGEGNGYPLQYSCLENPMDGGAWWAAVHGVTRSRTRLSDFTFTFHFPALADRFFMTSATLEASLCMLHLC